MSQICWEIAATWGTVGPFYRSGDKFGILEHSKNKCKQRIIVYVTDNSCTARVANLSAMIVGLKCVEPEHAERDAVLRSLLLGTVLLLAACASPSLPEAYRSKSQPGAIDCTAYPMPPAPTSCRNLYDDIIYRAQSRPTDTAGLF